MFELLELTGFNVVCAVLGGYIALFGLISYFCKERLYLSEALISTIVGVIASPLATNWIRPLEYAQMSQDNLNVITRYFTRLVLGVQLVIAGVQLPSRYLLIEWKGLSYLLGPGMIYMWLATSLLVWGLVPDTPILHALAIGACVTPTDPILSNNIVKGKFADKNIPKELQKIIIAESGANDGLGYPFLYLALFLIRSLGSQDGATYGNAGTAIGLWFGETWGYQIIFGILYGATVGWIAKELLHFAEEKELVDRESFLVFAIALALFIVGTCGMIGTDDVLACFIAGNVFTIDDWFRLETMDDSLQPTIDMLLNISIFLWFGAVAPWTSFGTNVLVPISRLIPLGLLVLLLRRLPMILASYKIISHVDDIVQALFMGFFGPIGVSAIFYLQVSLEFLGKITVNGEVRPDADDLGRKMVIIVWFLAICSIVVHGISVPLGKIGYSIPRTLFQTISADPQENDNPSAARIRQQARSGDEQLRLRRPAALVEIETHRVSQSTA